ncbi:uncharacterized protein MYU51_001553 [Penicillium brevicompactum]|uniref:uncharacterized protein n=1 Tax=Penicillium brevicompactum TaxID=5074 RepID=UPI002541C94D|nr:uncharacterized protein N7506_009958 [Penicillium brevicompactum]KAJ5326856.1 hypothetical protein N7506_009958 [Penicillium brevicompactum]
MPTAKQTAKKAAQQAKQEHEARIVQACAHAKTQEKTNLTKLARDFDVSYNVLRNRLVRGFKSANRPKLANRILQPAQEKEVLSRIADSRDRNLTVTPFMLNDWANDALIRAGSDRRVGTMWAYRFIKRLPKDLQVIQKRRDLPSVEVEAEDVSAVQSTPEFPIPASPQPIPDNGQGQLESPGVELTQPQGNEELSRNQQIIFRSLDQLDSMVDAKLERTILAETSYGETRNIYFARTNGCYGEHYRAF